MGSEAPRAKHRRLPWRWKDHDAYKQSFERVVRDLTVKPKVHDRSYAKVVKGMVARACMPVARRLSDCH
jgi:hypothetical protein